MPMAFRTTRLVGRLVVLGALASLVFLGAPQKADAAIIQALTRAAISPNDLISWGQFGAPVSAVPNPSNGTSTGGLAFTVSQAGAGALTLRQQSVAGWAGNFALGDFVLYTNGQLGPISIDFATPVNGAALQIQLGPSPAPSTCSLRTTPPCWPPSAGRATVAPPVTTPRLSWEPSTTPGRSALGGSG
jgi:hypothetical protein